MGDFPPPSSTEDSDEEALEGGRGEGVSIPTRCTEDKWCGFSQAEVCEAAFQLLMVLTDEVLLLLVMSCSCIL